LQLATGAVLMFADQVQDLLSPNVLLAPQKAWIDLSAAFVGKEEIGREHDGSTEDTESTEKDGKKMDKDGKMEKTDEEGKDGKLSKSRSRK